MTLVHHLLLINGLVDWHFIRYCQIFQDSVFEEVWNVAQSASSKLGWLRGI